MTDDVRAVPRIGSARWSPTRAVVTAGLVLVTATGCGLLPGLPGGGGAAPTGGDPGSAGQPAGEQDGAEKATGPGSSPADPIPLGQPTTIRSGVNGEFEWEVTITELDTSTFSAVGVGDTEDGDPCVGVIGTMTLVKGEGEINDFSVPSPYLVDENGAQADAGVCLPSADDAGYTSVLQIEAAVGETVEFADVYAVGPDAAAAIEVVDAVSLAEGGGGDYVYLAVR